jgi:hypothetical protein
MVFTDRLKEELERGPGSLSIRDSLSGANWAELNVTSLNGSSINLESEMKDLKIRYQPLISGATCFSSIPSRIDSHTDKPLHEHLSGATAFLNISNFGGFLVKILGSGSEVFS